MTVSSSSLENANNKAFPSRSICHPPLIRGAESRRRCPREKPSWPRGPQCLLVLGSFVAGASDRPTWARGKAWAPGAPQDCAVPAVRLISAGTHCEWGRHPPRVPRCPMLPGTRGAEQCSGNTGVGWCPLGTSVCTAVGWGDPPSRRPSPCRHLSLDVCLWPLLVQVPADDEIGFRPLRCPWGLSKHASAENN